MSTDILSRYLEVFELAGIQPDQRVVDKLQERYLPLEASYPFLSIAEEINLYQQISQYYSQGSEVSDAYSKQRADAILAQLQEIPDLAKDIIQKSRELSDCMQALKAEKYMRFEKMRPVLEEMVENTLSYYLNDNLSKDLSVIAKQPVELYFNYLRDPFIEQVCDTERLQRRLKMLVNVAEVAESLKKLTNYQAESLTQNIFILSDEQFDSYLEEVSNEFTFEENQCIHKLEQIISQMKNNSISILLEFKGLLKRKTVRSELSSSLPFIQLYCNNFFDDVDNLVLSIPQFCQNISLRTEEEICDKLVEIHKYRYNAAEYYAVAQVLLQDTNEFDSIKSSFKGVANSLKAKMDELIKATKIKMDSLTGQVKNIRFIMRESEKGEMVIARQGIHELALIYCEVNDMDLLKQMALPNDTVSAVQTGLGCLPYIYQLEDVCSYYNNLSRSVKEYEKPLLLNAAATFENELKKVAANSEFTLGNGQKDQGTVDRIKKITLHICKIKDKFENIINDLDKFHNTNMAMLVELKDVPLGQQKIWVDKISELRGSIDEYMKKVPENMQQSIYIYWSCALAHVMSVKYSEALTDNLAELRPLASISINNSIELYPTVEEIENLLFEEIQSISVLPLDSEYYICKNDKINVVFTKMAELSVERLPITFQTIETVVNNINKIVEFLSNNCGVVALASSRDNKLFAQKLQTLEDCQAVFMQGQQESNSEHTELFIISELPFLQEKQGERGIYTVFPSGGTVNIDIATAVRLLNQKEVALQQIAIGSSCFHCEQLADNLNAEVSEVFEKVEKGLAANLTAGEFSELTKYFSEVQNRAEIQMKAIVEEIEAFKDLISKSRFNYDDELKAVDTALQKYNQLLENLRNMSSTLAKKKDEMQQEFKDQLLKVAIPEVNRASSMLEVAIEQVKAYCDNSVKVKLPPGEEEYNELFSNLRTNKTTIAAFCKSFDDIQASYQKLNEVISSIDEQTRVLYGKPFTFLLTEKEITNVRDLQGQTKTIEFLNSNVIKLAKIEDLFSEFIKKEWSVIRLKFDIEQEIQESFDQFKQIELQQGDCSPEMASQLKNAQRAFITYATFMLKTSSSSVEVIKLLRSQALQKSHWHEISDATPLLSAVQAFSAQKTLSLPECCDGCSLLYIISSLLFVNAAAVISETPAPEYRAFVQQLRDVVNRAEGELTVRQAVEEVDYYLRNESKLHFSEIRLSALSQQELGGIMSYPCLPITAAMKPLLTNLSEKKALLQSVQCNPFAKSLKEQIDANFTIIEAMTRLAHVLIVLSRQLAILEPVMARKVLPDQHASFYSVLRCITYIVYNSVDAANRGLLADEKRQVPLNLMGILTCELPMQCQVTQMKSAFDNTALGRYEFIILQIESAEAILQLVESSLREYLEKKRLSFPRFYFLADEDVLEILANANQYPQKTLKPHVKKLFSQIEELLYDEGEQSIIGFRSQETEQLALKEQVKITGAPELWLKRLDLAIKETLKAELLGGLKLHFSAENVNALQDESDFEVNHSFQDVKTGKDVKFIAFNELEEAAKAQIQLENTSGEMLAVLLGVIFAAQIDYALAGGSNADDLLAKTLSKFEAHLQVFTARLFEPEISIATYGTSNYVLNLKLKALATDVTHYVKVCRELIASSKRAWLWSHEVKYRVHNSGDLYLNALNTDIPYTFEYEGLQDRLIHTPLTDRCYSTLITAISCSMSALAVGRAGTGKTESVKAFAAKLARPCIVFNCDSAIDREDLSRILIGIVLSGSMGCFDEINRLSSAVLAAVSTDIENIQKAIMSKSVGSIDGQLLLSDISVPIQKVSAFSAVFVTMNPASREYRGRSELPYSLVKLLRGCRMEKADVSLIMETILSTSGFKYAGIWAQKVDLTYELANRRIPKEVQLDWGLRSLQAVLRQAALARAGAFRSISGKALSEQEITDLERQSVMKALADATFSRVQSRSAEIFSEIMNDIFGKQQQAPESKFGAVSDVEKRLVQFIETDSERLGNLTLQLYRALTSKLGVALLGNTASGKSAIWDLLKSAVCRASEGKIKIQEYLISPNAMSRQDMLGYVDSNKEWVDGVLSKAARQAAVSTGHGVWQVLVFDGDVIPQWVEAMNSSLDASRLLSLSSGERIRFPNSMDPLETWMNAKGSSFPLPISFLFETDSLEHASPATVSRLGVILVADPSIEEQTKIVEQLNPGVAKCIAKLQKQKCNIQQVSSHMLMAGNGEIMMNKKSDFSLGALRCLFAEGVTDLSEAEYKELMLNFESAEISIKQNNISPEYSSKEDGYSASQIYNITLIKNYLNDGRSICVAGPKESGKFFCLCEAASYRDEYQVVVVSCTFLTTRDDILETIISECVESQKLDGSKELKPRTNKKLLIILRNADVVPVDEYGLSQVYTMLQSVVSNNLLYLKQGITVSLSGIQFAVTLQSRDSMPRRLLRHMGYAEMRELQEAEISSVIKGYYQEYVELSKQKQLQNYLQQVIQRSETVKLQARQQNARNAVALPEILQNCSVSFTMFQALGRLPGKYEGDELAALLSCLLEARQVYARGKQAASQDIKAISPQGQKQVFTYAIMGKTAQAVGKMLGQDEPAALEPHSPEYNTVKVRMNMLDELLGVVVEHYPAVRLYRQYLARLAPEDLYEQLKLLSSVEMQLNLHRGLLIISQPYNFSVECALISALTLACKPVFAGCDKISSAVIKALGEQIARNFAICVFIDSAVVQHDNQWIKFASAVASHDKNYLRNSLTVSDLRTLLGILGDNVQVNDLSEEQQIQLFLDKFVQNCRIVMILSPEFPFTDSLFVAAPTIRRTFGLVSFEIKEQDTLNPQILDIYRTLQEKPVPMEKQFFAFIKQAYARFMPPSAPVPNSLYIKAYMLFNMLRSTWISAVKERLQELQQGLAQLAFAQAEVDKLSSEAARSQKSVQSSEEEANSALQQIELKMKDVQQKQEAASRIKLQLGQKEVVITEKKNEAEAKLATVMPILQEATKAVQNIPNDALTEVKSFKAPPPAVNTVLEAVLTFMGNKDISWAGMRSFLSQGQVLRQIASFDVQKVPPQRIAKVLQIVQDNPKAFEQSAIQRVSKAAAPLAKWVEASLSYGQVYVQIEPLMKAAEEANKNLEGLRRELQQANDDLVRLEGETQTLKDNFNQKTEDVMRFKQQLEIIEAKKTRGSSMLQKLSSEKERWAINEKQSTEQLKKINNCALFASGLFLLTGNKTDDIRQSFWKDYRQSIFELLVQPQFSDQCQQFGLRISNEALENMAILDVIDSFPGFSSAVLSFVTDQTGVVDCLKHKYEDIEVVSASADNITNLIAIAARFGQKVIVTDCDSGKLPPALIPYFRYGEVAYKIQDSATIQIQEDSPMDYNLLQSNTTILTPSTTDKQVEVAYGFKIFAISSVGIELADDLTGRTIELSFAPTEQSRSDLYRDEVLNIWSPQTLSKLKELNDLQVNLRQQLYQIEKKLLQALFSSKNSANILEDDNLMSVLTEASNQAYEIKEAQCEAEKAEKVLESLKLQANHIAKAVNRSIIALEATQALNDLYTIDDCNILPLLRTVLQSRNIKSQDITREDVNYAIHGYNVQIFRRTEQSVFEQDKIGALAVLTRHCCPDAFSAPLFEFLSGTYTEKISEPITWAGEKYNSEFEELASAFGAEVCKRIQLQSTEQWGSLIAKTLSAKQIDNLLPQCADSLNPLEKLAIIEIIRPDLLSQGLLQACNELMDDQRIPVENPIEFALKNSSGIAQPIILFTIGGSDPTAELDADIIALAPGKEQSCTEQLAELLSNEVPPRLIIVKGAHLCLDWLSVLPSLLEQQGNVKTRIILLLEPKNNFPEGLSRISWRICLQQSSSPRQSMLDIVEEWPPLKCGLHRCLAYTISVLQVVMQSRQSFQPRGVANSPEWGASEALTLISVVARLTQSDCGRLVEQVKGYITDAVYGVKTIDSCDLTLIGAVTELLFSPEYVQALEKYQKARASAVYSLGENFQCVQEFSGFAKSADFFPFLRYALPPFGVLQQGSQDGGDVAGSLAEYISAVFPESPSADFLALEPSALLARGQKDGLVIKSILSRANSNIHADSDVQDNLYEQMINLSDKFGQFEQIQENIKKILDGAQRCKKTAALAEEIANQANTLLRLINTIQQDLEEARVAMQDYLLASQLIKEKAVLIQAQIIPESWAFQFISPPVSQAPPDAPDLVTLNAGTPEQYLEMLIESSHALAEALQACIASETEELPISVKLQLFPRPTSFLEAVRRYFGFVQKIELDKVKLYASNGRKGLVVLQKGAVQLNGATYGVGFDFQQGEAIMGDIALCGEQSGKDVPFYADKDRKVKMPIESVKYEANEGTQRYIDVFGVYCCLVGR